MRWLLLIVAVCSWKAGWGQDTISVYFEFGKWRIPHDQMQVLEAIPYRVDLSMLDSVQYIGMADSIGTSGSNMKLSAKRARVVADHCRNIIPAGSHTSSFPMGALNQGDRARNRRVDVVFHLQRGAAEKEEAPASSEPRPEDPELPCYVTDCDLLSRCLARSFMKGRREFVEIEIPGGLTVPNPSGEVIDPALPRYRSRLGASGPAEVIRIKWSRKPARRRKAPSSFITAIPKEDFDRWGVRISKEGDCFEIPMDTCMRIDHALMQELQYDQRFLSSTRMHIRAPRRSVLPDARYYSGCKPLVPLVWKERKGRKRSEFYYAELPLILGAALPISREMRSCHDHCDTTGCGKGYWKLRCMSPPDEAPKLTVETGYHWQANDNKAYLTMGLYKAGLWSLITAHAGVDTELRPLATARYQFHFLNIPFGALNPLSDWRWTTDEPLVYQYLRAYAGAECRWRGGDEADRLLEPNVHFGLAYVNEKSTATFTRIFAQLGTGADLLSAGSKQAYLLGNFGCMIRLTRFGTE